MTSMEHHGRLSEEDEALFGPLNQRSRMKIDRAVILFVAILVGISMMAGFVGGLPVAFANRCMLANTFAPDSFADEGLR